MAGTASISGLGSGLDTASIISQLMQLEAAPQTRLKVRVGTEQTAVTSMQSVNTKLAALATKADDLAKATGWSPIKASSSSEDVTVTTAAGAAPTKVSLTVGDLALAHKLVYEATAALTDVITSGSSSVRLTQHDGSTVDVDTGDGTLSGLVSALNRSGAGVRASTVRLDDGTYRLRVEAATSGAASDFTLTNLDGTDLLGGATVTAGRDASITIGGDVIHSSTNTFANLLPGVSVTLGSRAVPGTAVDLDLATDTDAMSAKVKDFVNTLNGVLSDIDTATKTASTGVAGGPLAGDSGLRAVRDQLVSTLFAGTGGSLAGSGIQLDRNGTFTFDETKFAASYQADPAATAALFTKATESTGWADRINAVAKAASDPYDGTVTAAINGRKTGIDRLNRDIADWDTRLELKQLSLQRQFTALDTAINQMNSQSSWLAGQIANLPTNG